MKAPQATVTPHPNMASSTASKRADRIGGNPCNAVTTGLPVAVTATSMTAICHLHDGDHGDTMIPNRGPEVRQWVCSGCHSPRYVREQFANGKRQLTIADLKLKEGEALIASAADAQHEVLSKLRKNLIHHRKNVLLGVGHQSPDYQWWHGQPALDGDLIRVRDALTKTPYDY